MHTSEEIISEMAEKIRRAVDPDRIVLFGSRARDDSGSRSDYDLLIVARSPLPRWQRAVAIYRLLAGMGATKDIVWWTPQEVAKWRGVGWHFISTVLREGRVIYERSA